MNRSEIYIGLNSVAAFRERVGASSPTTALIASLAHINAFLLERSNIVPNPAQLDQRSNTTIGCVDRLLLRFTYLGYAGLYIF